MKKLVLFDFDGTVIDGSAGIYNCINYATDKMGLPRATPDVLRSFVGPSLHDSFMLHYEPDSARAELFAKLYRERYAPVGKYECVLYPGVKAMLERLTAAGLQTAVCSSKPLAFVTDIAKHLDIFSLFGFYSCPGFKETDSDKTALAKACLSHFGTDAADAILVGDRKFDVEAAHGAGMQAMGVSYGFAPPGELEAAGADLVADTPTQIGVLLLDCAE